MKELYKAFATLFYLFSALAAGSGFYFLYAYENTETSKINVIVGGDAYNYIINSGRATVWMILSLVCATIATGSLIIGAIDRLKTKE